MAFTSITSGTHTFVPRAPGVYPEDSLSFSDPKFEVRLTGATRNKDKTLSGAVTVLKEKDVTVNGITTRHRCLITTTIYTDIAFTADEVKETAKAGSDFIQTSNNASRLLQGDS